MNKYCPLCGKKTIKQEKEGFNPETGERNFKMICPDEKCVSGCESRGGHFWDKPKDVMDWLFRQTSNRCMRCTVCKEEVYGGFY